jgi:hypothetical protein
MIGVTAGRSDLCHSEPEARASRTAVDPWLGVRRLAWRKIRGPSASLGMTQRRSVMTPEVGDREKRTYSKRASSPFCDFFFTGAGVTPAEGSVKPTAGFTFD